MNIATEFNNYSRFMILTVSMKKHIDAWGTLLLIDNLLYSYEWIIEGQTDPGSQLWTWLKRISKTDRHIHKRYTWKKSMTCVWASNISNYKHLTCLAPRISQITDTTRESDTTYIEALQIISDRYRILGYWKLINQLLRNMIQFYAC